MDTARIYEYPVEKIHINRLVKSEFNVRYSVGDISELVKSISSLGLLEPLIVRPKSNYFEVICGNRRLEACRKLNYKFVPCIIKDVNDREANLISIVENVQRETLDPIDEARSYMNFVEKYGWGGISELARLIGKSEPYVSHRIGLLKLPQEIQELIGRRQLKPSIAMEIVRVKKDRQAELVPLILKNNMSVRDIRKKIKDENLNTESDLYLVAFRKAKLLIKSCLINFDEIIEKVQSEPELISDLMNVRQGLHKLIDDIIHMEKERKQKERTRHF
ncbi:MAG: ParB/RepB/Spo0J family partition protein [Conexivisphaerales archaeon]